MVPFGANQHVAHGTGPPSKSKERNPAAEMPQSCMHAAGLYYLLVTCADPSLMGQVTENTHGSSQQHISPITVAAVVRVIAPGAVCGTVWTVAAQARRRLRPLLRDRRDLGRRFEAPRATHSRQTCPGGGVPWTFVYSMHPQHNATGSPSAPRASGKQGSSPSEIVPWRPP